MRAPAPRIPGLARLLTPALALALAACASVLPAAEGDLERTWNAARVVLPDASGGAPVFTSLEALARNPSPTAPYQRKPLAVVLYMHGCDGIGRYDFLGRLAAAGFAVIIPDSFARRYRPLQCDPATKTGGYNLFVYDFRLAEVAFAVQRLRRLGWVDAANLFLMGVSEGGVAAALYRGDEFRGRVITQWTCHGSPIVAGIAAPPDEPVLAVVRSSDPWYDPARTQDQAGDCGAYLAGRPGSRSLVLPKNGSHEVFDDAATMSTVLAFLRLNRSDHND